MIALGSISIRYAS